jgi:hypothetical protein
MIGETKSGPVPTATIDIETAESPETSETPKAASAGLGEAARSREIGGRDGPDPTRYGDWEKNGRCIDF